MTSIIPLPVILISLLILVLFSFFFSASETAIISLSKIRLRHMVAKGIKRAASVQRLVTKLDKFIAAILIGNNFASIAISAIATALSVQVFGYRWGVIIATFATTFFVLIFCEITPKILATKHNDKIALYVSPFMELFIKIFHPLIVFFTGITNFILRIFLVAPAKRSPLITEEELRLMIEVGKDEGVVSDEERKMLHRIFEFGDLKVGDVMVPKDQIVSIDVKASPDELLNIFVEEGHSRLPVYEGSIEKVIGIIYARDLLYILRDNSLFVVQDLVQKAYYAASKMRVHDLLKDFQAQKMQIAIVVDENNKTLGVVTLEDLIEEIVGEIEEAVQPL